MPLTWGIGEIARTATEDDAIEGVSVGCSDCTTLGVVATFVGIFIMGCVW